MSLHRNPPGSRSYRDCCKPGDLPRTSAGRAMTQDLDAILNRFPNEYECRISYLERLRMHLPAPSDIRGPSRSRYKAHAPYPRPETCVTALAIVPNPDNHVLSPTPLRSMQ